MEIKTIVCKWPKTPEMLNKLKGMKEAFFEILKKNQQPLCSKVPAEVFESEGLLELAKLKSEFIQDFSAYLSYPGHRGKDKTILDWSRQM